MCLWAAKMEKLLLGQSRKTKESTKTAEGTGSRGRIARSKGCFGGKKQQGRWLLLFLPGKVDIKCSSEFWGTSGLTGLNPAYSSYLDPPRTPLEESF